MKNHVTFLILSVWLSASIAAKIPNIFRRCKGSDPNLNQCLKPAIEDAFHKLANGIPDLGVPTLQPLNVPSLTIQAGNGPVNVLQKFNNISIYNILNSKIEHIDVSLGNPLKITIRSSAPEYRVEGNYDFNGRVLLLPIVGNGKCQVKFLDITTDMIIEGEKIEKKGVAYVALKDFKVLLKPQKVHYNFENLFNGDEALGREMNNVLNDNWKEVFEDVRSGYEEFIGSLGKHIAIGIFAKIPYDELFSQ